MVTQLVGTWNLESSENWEEYMKELGVGLFQRKAAATIKPTVIISNNGNQWTLKLQSTLKNSELTASEGVEFNESNLTKNFRIGIH
jgi:fatty acid-binding protein 4